jgi:hypothetical protein
MKSRGLSLVGLLVALALFSVVTGSIYGLLTPPQGGYRVQTPHVELNENVRNALTVLSSEIRELDANDPVGGDIVSRTASSVTYRAVRNLYFVCQPPDPVTGQIVVAQDSWHGLRPIDPVRDWVLVLQENDPDTRQDDLWLRTDLAGVSMGTACPGSAPSLTLTVTNRAPDSQVWPKAPHSADLSWSSSCWTKTMTGSGGSPCGNSTNRLDTGIRWKNFSDL